MGRDGKTYKRTNNVCVNFFLARVKSVPNFTLFCRKSELCRDFALFGVILMAYVVNYKLLFQQEGQIQLIT